MSTEITVDTGTNELLCVIRDRVAIITLNRPEARNSLSDELTPALRTMIKTCGENPQVGALLITGAGTAFCSGGNVKGMGAHRDKKRQEMSDADKIADLQERQRLLTGALVSVRKPTIAALPGAAAGAGLALAMACDIRIAAQSAFVSTGYLNVALPGDYGMAWLLTRLVGTSRARELMFTAERVTAARCEAIGLVNRVVPDDKLQEEAFALAKAMAAGPTIALRYMKDNLDEALMFDFATARDHEAERMIRAQKSADHREAVQAFIDKRKPVFAGNSSQRKMGPSCCRRTGPSRSTRDRGGGDIAGKCCELPACTGNVLRREIDRLGEAHQLPVAGAVAEGVAGLLGSASMDSLERSVSPKMLSAPNDAARHSKFFNSALPMPWPCQRSSIDSPNSSVEVWKLKA